MTSSCNCPIVLLDRLSNFVPHPPPQKKKIATTIKYLNNKAFFDHNNNDNDDDSNNINNYNNNNNGCGHTRDLTLVKGFNRGKKDVKKTLP